MEKQQTPNAVLSGRVTTLQGRPLAGLVVRAFTGTRDAAGARLGSDAVTDARGQYQITFPQAALRPPDGDAPSAGLFVRISQGGRLIGESEAAAAPETRTTLDVALDHAAADPQEPVRQVSGTVRDPDRRPMPDLLVRVANRDFRSEELLGETRTDLDGFYELPYFARQFRRAEKQYADLIVHVLDAAGAELASSAVLFNAPAAAEIDVTVPADRLFAPDLFQRIAQSLAPVLDGFAIEKIEEDERNRDLTFLAGETGFGKPVLARFVLAHRLVQDALPAEFWFVLLGGGFYAFSETRALDAQLAIVRQDLPSLDAAAVRKSLARGFAQREIADSFRGSAEPWTTAFLASMARRTATTGSKPTLVTAALDDAGIDGSSKREIFARLFNEHKALTPALIAELEKQPSFTRPELANLRTTFELADLTRADVSVVRLLKSQLDVVEPERIRTLARKSADEWIQLVAEAERAGKITLPVQVPKSEATPTLPGAEIYGRTLERRFREAYPTAAFAGSLGRAQKDRATNGLRQSDSLQRFFETHQDFDLLTTPAHSFLEKTAKADNRTAAIAQDEGFRRELMSVQRVFKLAPTFEATDTLLADGLHSAQQVYRLGETEFVRRYGTRAGFTAESARTAWSRAAATHAAVLTIVGDLKSLDAEALPKALANGNAALEAFPNWENLFNGGDICECEHCRSVLSPSAYFADILMFLRDRPAKNPARSVKEILFDRRPDLGYLELSCANALTTLPYIDVVCEVLESAVAGGANDVELTGFTVMPAAAPAARAAVAAALEDVEISLGEPFTLSQEDPSNPNRWVVHGAAVSYLLKKKGGPNFFAERLRNSKTGAAELRAYPQYVNPKAYETLRGAKYPMQLPFDLFGDEVRAAFGKTNLRRWELMQTLRGTAPGNPTVAQIAAEYFGISIDTAAPFDERRLILVADTSVAGQQALWGVSGGGWLNAVGNVKTFLDKTGLEYEELLALLDLPFLNPAGDIAIHHLDASCDTSQKVLQVLDATKLDRLHRFLRLWRKLKGWKMWELDLVIQHPAIGKGALDEPFLVALFDFSRVKARLGTKASVEQVAALFGDLNTASRFTAAHAPREEALYQKLFVNPRLINPIDPAFVIDTGTGDVPAGQTLTAHQTVVVSALGLREPDLLVVEQLVKTNGTPYITDTLTLANLSFVWRHAWLAKLLGIKTTEWPTLLKLLQQDVAQFATPAAAWSFIERVDRVKACGFSLDELSWLLAADPAAKAAVKETDAARFLAALRKELQRIRAEFDPAQYPFLGAVPPVDVEALTTLLTTLLQQVNRDEPAAQLFIATLRDEVTQEVAGGILPPPWVFPPVITGAPNNIPIRYEHPVLRFTGVMTTAQRTTLLTHPSLAAISGLAAYQQAIAALFDAPRLALKFFDPVFTAPLASLPANVDFAALPDAALARRVSYDAEQRLLRAAGILSAADRAALDALSADAPYRAAVNSLFTQPPLVSAPDPRIWLVDADLQFPLRDLAVPANDHLAANLATAITKVLAYLGTTQAASAVVEQSAAQLGLTEAMTRRLLTAYALLPATLLAHLTGPFAATSGVIDAATLPSTFRGWYWAQRSASLLARWKLTLDDWERLTALTAGAQLLDLLTLPQTAAGPVAPIDRLLRTGRLLRIREALPETQVAFFDVLKTLSAGGYATAADFAADVERTSDWPKADVTTLVAGLDIAYPAGYLLAESWERLRGAFALLAALNAGAATARTFAAVTMTAAHTKRLAELLRSRFGTETWLTLCAEIQDVLRERKRDALAAYLLARPQPPDAPTGKWENTNDLYAYYLLDVEMSSCQLTSRLVQGSGSVQLFVQRCFLGIEPAVEVIADGPDGDSAWRWWAWMRKYRVWEANRKVFLWPENWIEPELKPDRSPFFKDLENDLLQNEINPATVEAAFAAYLEKLRGVAQLEIAGFYQEDDGDNTIVHLFGRTPGAEPHLYYYRRYDYRQWTPWEKVELDIQGDYLIPCVIGTRLFLLWPVYSEVPDEDENSTVTVPKVDLNKKTSFDVDKVYKRLRMQMAVSDYRQGKWTPKRVSTDYLESYPYNVEIVKKEYVFYPIDRSEIDGRFGIKCEGWSVSGSPGSPSYAAGLWGTFEVAGCSGVPTLTSMPGYFEPALKPEYPSVAGRTSFMKWVELGPYPAREDAPENDFRLENAFSSGSDYLQQTPVLLQTPWLFTMTPPWHLSYLDRLIVDGLVGLGMDNNDGAYAPVGTWLPFFYNDKKRTFLVLPSFGGTPQRGKEGEEGGSAARLYYPEIKQGFRQWDRFFEGLVRTWLDGIDLTALTPPQRQALDTFLWQAFPEQAAAPDPGGVPPPYTPAQVTEIKNLMTRWYMRFFHYYLGVWSAAMFQFRQFHFKNHYHPFVCDFAKLVYNPLKGIPALMSRETQLKNSGFDFARTYQPTPWVVEPGTKQFYPQEIVDFTPDGAYAPYNWELFFHAPLLIANALSRNQRFEEARDWYHFIFNPVGVASPMPGGSPMSKYWITKPFFETTSADYVQQRIENLLRMLAGDTTVDDYSTATRDAIAAQVVDWRTHPFEPHRIANYRTVAYQKTVVMKYLDNLIAWGDNLFRQDTMESTSEATQLYILAAEILGPRPRKVPPREVPPLESFNELELQFDAFSNALIDVENLVPVLPEPEEGADPAPLPMLYFCIPHNEKLLGYWDTVADRLYKLRHCMNIEGVVRQLALFEPPIDPAALVKAVAGGMDLSSALADLNAPLPLYRFAPMLQRANEVCGDVKALGAALLVALEKKDAEALARLRQDHEIRVLNAVRTVRERQIDEATEQLRALERNKELVTIRRDYFQKIEKISAGEHLHQAKLEAALTAQQISQVINIAASIAHIVPTFDLGIAGFGGSPKAAVMFGGPNVGSALQAAAGGFQFWANVENYNANKASINAGHERRWEEWKHQEKLADKELEQLDRSIAAATVRLAVAEKELENHLLQLENATATDAFMRTKYTNEELYRWQITQTSNVFFKSYRLAYDLAKRAERCLRFELGLQDSSLINFGYWDSLKKGLQSGEALQYDLRRLEAAYTEQNRRDFELTKHVSLALIDPLALVMLRETGRCFIRLPEELFDLDFPGHYFRRLKSVSLTLPCVAGPFTTISATLRLVKNSVRITTGNGDNGYPRNTDDAGLPADDTRFVEHNTPVKAVAVSGAQNDSGLFELNFRDERYLPFEGAGAVSDWALELFTDLPANNPDPGNPDFGRPLRQFDYTTISDAILTVKYTAREDAGPFKNGAIAHLRAYLAEDTTVPSVRMFDVRREFPGEWHRFLHPTNPAAGNVLDIALSRDRFRVLDAGKTIKVNRLTLLARCRDAGAYAMRLSPLPPPPPPGADTVSMTPLNQYGGLHVATKAVDAFAVELPPAGAPVSWQLRMTRPGGGDLQIDPVTNAMEVEDLYLVLGYEWE